MLKLMGSVLLATGRAKNQLLFRNFSVTKLTLNQKFNICYGPVQNLDGKSEKKLFRSQGHR